MTLVRTIAPVGPAESHGLASGCAIDTQTVHKRALCILHGPLATGSTPCLEMLPPTGLHSPIACPCSYPQPQPHNTAPPLRNQPRPQSSTPPRTHTHMTRTLLDLRISGTTSSAPGLHALPSPLPLARSLSRSSSISCSLSRTCRAARSMGDGDRSDSLPRRTSTLASPAPYSTPGRARPREGVPRGLASPAPDSNPSPGRARPREGLPRTPAAAAAATVAFAGDGPLVRPRTEPLPLPLLGVVMRAAAAVAEGAAPAAVAAVGAAEAVAAAAAAAAAGAVLRACKGGTC